MWVLLAFGAAVLWGVSYAASGRVIQRGFNPVAFFFCYAVFTTLVTGAILLAKGEMLELPRGMRELGSDRVWLLVSLASAAAGGLLILGGVFTIFVANRG